MIRFYIRRHIIYLSFFSSSIFYFLLLLVSSSSLSFNSCSFIWQFLFFFSRFPLNYIIIIVIIINTIHVEKIWLLINEQWLLSSFSYYIVVSLFAAAKNRLYSKFFLIILFCFVLLGGCYAMINFFLVINGCIWS